MFYVLVIRFNPFMHNAEKWPNLFLKNAMFTPQDF